ncbi:sugar phosphate nucleotidyltransferase [Paracoccaceae bacterium]|nr:sugar phosphate nucleotidyltransferase [Paracoccaceae bacterium]
MDESDNRKKFWKKTVVSEDATIRDIIENLNRYGLKTVYLVDNEEKLLASINDGDIRRSFYKKADLETQALSVANKKPIIGSELEPQSIHRSKIQQYNLFSLPIVGTSMHLKEVIFNRALIDGQKRKNTVLIMAGGYGRRLGELTTHIPKPLLPVGGTPIILHIIQNLSGFGFKKFIISLHYLGQKIRDFLGDGSKFNINIQYIEEEKPLGTAGCLQLLNGKIDNDLIIVNGDVFCDLDYNELINFHLKQDTLVTMVIRNFELKNPYGTVTIDNNLMSEFIEKPSYVSYVNAGIYIVKKEAIYSITKNENIDMPEFLLRLKNSGSFISTFLTDNYWVDIGHTAELEQIKKIIV